MTDTEVGVGPAPTGERRLALRGPATRRTEEPLLISLVAAGFLTDEDASEVRLLHHREGGWIGRVLLAHGFCSRLELYGTWAGCLGLKFVDLIKEPPDPALVQQQDSARMLSESWIGWRLRDEAGQHLLVVATSDPDACPFAAIRAAFHVSRIELILTTDWDILRAVSAEAGAAMAHMAAEGLAESQPHLSAKHGPGWLQWSVFGVVLAVLVGAMAWDPFIGLDSVLTVMNLYFDAAIATKIIFCLVGAREVRKAEETRLRRIVAGSGVVHRRVVDSALPIFTILVPCYKEANVISGLLENLERLDYPRSKLQVLVLLEVDDIETIEAAKASRTPDYMRIVILPDGEPRTKPRACNIGLTMARGKYLVIYDAEDKPEPAQLRDVVDRFDELSPEFVCLQARLNYFNANQNFLTRMFTLEYSLWFDYLLVGLASLGIPMPLGGTSNHFRTAALREIGGWDPYNVTEDADLGIRAMAHGYRVGVIESTTWEEACSRVRPWIRQRTRWIKGYMVTATVHTRSLRKLQRTTGWRGLASLVLFIGGTPVTFLVNPLVLAWGLYGIFGLPLPNFRLPGSITALNTFSLAFGSASMIALSLMAARRRKQWSIMGYAMLNPVYWLLHSTAAWRALVQLVRSPSEWEKTPHGLIDPDQDKAT
ncbi:MAG: glycosyltransferase [Acidimicrobiales bacterium]